MGNFVLSLKIVIFQWMFWRRGEGDPRTRFASDPQMKSQNGIFGMPFPLCRPTLTRFAFRQNILICIY